MSRERFLKGLQQQADAQYKVFTRRYGQQIIDVLELPIKFVLSPFTLAFDIAGSAPRGFGVPEFISKLSYSAIFLVATVGTYDIAMELGKKVICERIRDIARRWDQKPRRESTNCFSGWRNFLRTVSQVLKFLDPFEYLSFRAVSKRCQLVAPTEICRLEENNSTPRLILPVIHKRVISIVDPRFGGELRSSVSVPPEVPKNARIHYARHGWLLMSSAGDRSVKSLQQISTGLQIVGDGPVKNRVDFYKTLTSRGITSGPTKYPYQQLEVVVSIAISGKLADIHCTPPWEIKPCYEPTTTALVDCPTIQKDLKKPLQNPRSRSKSCSVCIKGIIFPPV